MGSSCRDRPIRSGRLIDTYRIAACVEPSIAKGVAPPTRGCDAHVITSNGSTVTVTGATMVGGNISVRYEPDGPQVFAAQPGDYVYPTDVRIHARHINLYIKARGAAAGIWDETWLYEFDLENRRQVSRALVESTVLSPECPCR
jgi:hypothetical protein